MQKVLQDIIKIFKQFVKNMPVLFAKHLRLIFFAGIFLTFIIGFFMFYTKAYKVVKATYVGPATTFNINKAVLGEAIKHINEHHSAEPVPVENPFTP